MPMIMEDGINVDDLFGESASLELGLTPTPSKRGLPQRLDEMRLLGCCQKIAWSKQGCIANITQDASRVNLRHLECRPTDGKWVLSDDTQLLPVTEVHGGHPLVHLCWNEVGSELAVVDSSGRVSIYSISFALNSLSGQRQGAFDPDDDGAQIVGMMWLNVHRSVQAFSQANKRQGRWNYSSFRRRPIGPFHPAGKAGLICITRSGVIRFLYQNPDLRWTEISAELKNTSYSDRLLTHAALVATPGGILIVTHSACQKICFYRLQINWTPPQWDQSQMKQGSNQFPVPSFRFMHSKVEVPYDIPMSCVPGQNPEHLTPPPNPFYRLTHLDAILATQETATNPWVVAVFSVSPHASPVHPQQQGPPSIIVRWQLETAPQVLHPKFDEVVSKKSNVQIKTEYGNVVAVVYDDSSISFYDANTMAVCNGFGDAETVTCLAQAGFQYPADSTGLSISFSPSGCNAVMLDSDGQVQLRCMEHAYGAESGLFDETIASLTMAFCRAVGSDMNSDDILIILRQQLSADAQSMFMHGVYRALPVNCDFTLENDKLVSNHTRKDRKENHLTRRPEAVRMLLGNTKWLLDFLQYTLNEVLELANEFESVSSDQEAFSQKLKTIRSLPLIVILSGMSRSLLRFIGRGLRGIYASYSTLPLIGDSRVYYAEICQTIDSLPVRLDLYDKFIFEADGAVREAYKRAGFKEGERPGAEKELLLNARIPHVLIGAVATLLQHSMPILRPQIDCMAIYLSDYSWLGLGTDPRAEMYRRTRDVDIVKKLPLRTVGRDEQQEGKHNSHGQVRRRCVRCCGLLCGPYPPRTHVSFRMLYKTGLVRYCVCGAAWTMESETNR
ncbi:mediator complex, subunit Med16 [Aspergillus floccosus]